MHFYGLRAHICTNISKLNNNKIKTITIKDEANAIVSSLTHHKYCQIERITASAVQQFALCHATLIALYSYATMKNCSFFFLISARNVWHIELIAMKLSVINGMSGK